MRLALSLQNQFVLLRRTPGGHRHACLLQEELGNVAKLGMGAYCAWYRASICRSFRSGRSRTHTGVNALLLRVAPTNPPLCVHKSPTLCLLPLRVQACDPYGYWLLTLTGDPYATPDSRPLHLDEVSIPNFATLPNFEPH